MVKGLSSFFNYLMKSCVHRFTFLLCQVIVRDIVGSEERLDGDLIQNGFYGLQDNRGLDKRSEVFGRAIWFSSPFLGIKTTLRLFEFFPRNWDVVARQTYFVDNA